MRTKGKGTPAHVEGGLGQLEGCVPTGPVRLLEGLASHHSCSFPIRSDPPSPTTPRSGSDNDPVAGRSGSSGTLLLQHCGADGRLDARRIAAGVVATAIAAISSRMGRHPPPKEAGWTMATSRMGRKVCFLLCIFVDVVDALFLAVVVVVPFRHVSARGEAERFGLRLGQHGGLLRRFL